MLCGSALAQETPVAMDDFFNTSADSTLTIDAPGILGNDSANEPFEAVLATSPANGTLSLSADGSFVYTPNSGFTGTDTFTYYTLTLDVPEEFVVDATRSGANMTAVLTTEQLGSRTDSDSSGISGTIKAEIVPNAEPFSEAQFLEMQLFLADDMVFTFDFTLLGNIIVSTDADSLELGLATIGPVAPVTGGAFLQAGDSLSMKGRLDVSATGLLANAVPSGPAFLDVKVPTDIAGTIVQDGSDLTLSFPLNAQGSFDVDANTVDVDLQGTVVATGPVVVRKESNLAVVAIVVQATGVGTELAEGSARSFDLGQNFPNPAAGPTAIAFNVPAASHVSLAVYDALGRQVMALVDAIRAEGTHRALVDASTLPAGIYFYRLQADGRSDMKKMIVLR
jgi:hypothetical protein